LQAFYRWKITGKEYANSVQPAGAPRIWDPIGLDKR
jgi:hypothetical protein